MNTNYTTIVRMMILHFCFNNCIKYDHNHAVISQRDSTMGKPLWNTTSGVPQRLAHDGVPQWYSTTGASENVTPVRNRKWRVQDKTVMKKLWGYFDIYFLII